MPIEMNGKTIEVKTFAEGYTTDNKCVTAEMLGYPPEQGAMGLGQNPASE